MPDVTLNIIILILILIGIFALGVIFSPKILDYRQKIQNKVDKKNSKEKEA